MGSCSSKLSATSVINFYGWPMIQLIVIPAYGCSLPEYPLPLRRSSCEEDSSSSSEMEALSSLLVEGPAGLQVPPP